MTTKEKSGCIYCRKQDIVIGKDENVGLPIINFGYGRCYINLEDNSLDVVGDNCSNSDISYCPKCGRKL